MNASSSHSTLFVSDLDGTLLGSDRKVTPESTQLLNEAISRGALFSIATARTPATVDALMKDVDCRVPLIVMTGAAVWNPKANTYSHVRYHREETARRLVDTYRRLGLSTFMYTLEDDNLIHIYHIGPIGELEQGFIDERSDSRFKQLHIPASGDSSLPEKLDNVILFYAMRPTEEVKRVYDEIRDDDDLRAVFYHDMYGEEIALMEVFGPGASKANAIKALAEELKVDKIVAYGDNVNDLPMLQLADDAVCVANAVPEVHAAASRSIGPNTDDSVPKDILAQLVISN